MGFWARVFQFIKEKLGQAVDAGLKWGRRFVERRCEKVQERLRERQARPHSPQSGFTARLGNIAEVAWLHVQHAFYSAVEFLLTEVSATAVVNGLLVLLLRRAPSWLAAFLVPLRT